MTSTAAKKGGILASPYQQNRPSGAAGGAGSRWGGCFQLVLLISAFVWVLAVIKVFLLEKFYTTTDSGPGREAIAGHANVPLLNGLPSPNLQSKFSVQTKEFIKAGVPAQDTGSGKGVTDPTAWHYLPHASEWLMARSHQGGEPYNAGGGKDVHGVALQGKEMVTNFKQISVKHSEPKPDAPSEHQHAQLGQVCTVRAACPALLMSCLCPILHMY